MPQDDKEKNRKIKSPPVMVRPEGEIDFNRYPGLLRWTKRRLHVEWLSGRRFRRADTGPILEARRYEARESRGEEATSERHP
jgi:hypothetical protein